MELYQLIDQAMAKPSKGIVKLRPAFSREVPFEWFVLLLWGALLSHQPAAVSSYLNGVGLGEAYYGQALHWFHSTAFTMDEVCLRWGRWLSNHSSIKTLKGQRVYAGDGIKVSKEGRKMPGIKGLHQESEDVSKPEWIRGHYFSALSLLLGSGSALFAVPLGLKLHDGIEPVEADRGLTLVDKMAAVCVAFMVTGSYGLLDAYYASAKILKPFRAAGLHLISRAPISTVGRAAFSANPSVRGPGRPRQWGSDVKLRALFAPIEQCTQATV